MHPRTGCDVSPTGSTRVTEISTPKGKAKRTHLHIHRTFCYLHSLHRVPHDLYEDIPGEILRRQFWPPIGGRGTLGRRRERESCAQWRQQRPKHPTTGEQVTQNASAFAASGSRPTVRSLVPAIDVVRSSSDAGLYKESRMAPEAVGVRNEPVVDQEPQCKEFQSMIY